MKQDLRPEASQSNDGQRELTLFRLYIADETITSVQALANLEAICGNYVRGPYKVEVVDILIEPLRALSDGIIVTPTLVRLSPLPTRHIVGDLCDTTAVLQTLGLSGNAKNAQG